jgi:peptidyl-prolyl cis-trans isomerase A (cyclophilin A)
MEVVRQIFAAPTDPEKGEGWMKGQMLVEPVVILHARRAAKAG